MSIVIQSRFALTKSEEKEIIKGLEPMVEGKAFMPNIKITLTKKELLGSYNSSGEVFTVEDVKEIKPKAKK